MSLSASPKHSVPFLKAHLSPVQPVDAKRVQALIGDLDSEQFAVRDKAAKELAKIVEQIEPMLKKAQEASPSAEVKRRIASLLGAPHEAPTGDRLRTLRAIAALERIGTPEARDVLKGIAEGDAAARETREAKESLARMGR
jgi:HEAT repeat protein